jgi:hypothetical protein
MILTAAGYSAVGITDVLWVVGIWMVLFGVML